MKKIKLMKLDERAVIPVFAKDGDSGFDMYTLEDTVIKAGETKIVKTGIAADLEDGYEIQVRPRSGVSLNGVKGCYKYIETTRQSVLNKNSYIQIIEDSYGQTINVFGDDKETKVKQNKTIAPYLRVQFGTVDSGYKGDIGIITYNQEDYDVLVPKGTRLAQCVVMEVPKVELVEVFELSDSKRGNTGFGSSGIN